MVCVSVGVRIGICVGVCGCKTKSLCEEVCNNGMETCALGQL